MKPLVGAFQMFVVTIRTNGGKTLQLLLQTHFFHTPKLAVTV